MCIAAPGIVTAVDGDSATVDYNGNKISALSGIVDVKPGDRVLVHAGLIIQVLPDDEADKMEEIFKSLEEFR